MTEAEWLTCNNVQEMNEYVQMIGTQRQLKLFLCACARLMLPVIESREDVHENPGARAALYQAEQFADGLVDVPTMTVWYDRMSQTLDSFTSNDRLCGSLLHKAYWVCTFACWAGEPAVQTVWIYFEWETGTEYAPIEMRKCLSPTYRDIFGNPFRPVAFAPEWRTDTAIFLARQMYESRDFSAMPILADALQDAGCDNDDILNHCRGPGPHVRGCWVVDLVLGKE